MPAKIFGDLVLESPHPSDAATAFPDSILPASSPPTQNGNHILSSPTHNAPSTTVHAGPTADVVVSGMSGRLPESDNLEEFRDNLMGGVDMVTDDGRRWTPGLHNLPKRGGKLKDISKFDASFFGVHGKQANAMDPQLRLLLEVTYEALVDAGVNPGSARGSRTGVFVGCSGSEAQDAWTTDMEELAGYEMTGCTRSMFANRLSFFFDFKGPSYAIDTACSSSLLALHQAIQAMRSDECDAAVVAGCNLCLKPATTMQFQKLGMLSPDGACKSFDASGNGYVRSEAVVAVYLQRAPNAKRIYATLVHSKHNTDGNKSQGITFPSGAVQKRLLEEVYSECGVDPASISYIEAHGTGTKVGDPQEVNTIADVFCRKGRRGGPLLIGSTKSNMGHPEPASGLAALVKVLIAMEERQLPPNLHFKDPNPDIPALTDGRLKVVSERTPWNGGCAAINSFGFGGANVHVVLKSYEHNTERMEHPAAKLPRLLTISGRTDVGVESVLSTMKKQAENVAAQALLQESSTQPTQSHPYRGYCILNSESNTSTDVQATPVSRGPVWFVFAGMGTQWHGMGRALMPLEVFRASILRSHAALAPYDVALYNLLMSDGAEAFDDTMNSFVCIAAIQVALVDLLRSLHISPDGIVGHSVGELGCAYADGGLTAEQTVLAAYWRGRCVKEANLPPGGMAAVGLTWIEAKKRCPQGVVPACHNSLDTITISGPKDDVSKFVAELKEEGVFAKEVNSAGVAFHSYYMARTAPALRKALEKVIPEPRARTERWVSSSIPQEMWDSELARTSSAEYHVNNLLSPVLFQEALEQVPRNAVVIEIAPHCLLQAILKRSLGGDCTFVGLMKRNHPDNMDFFLTNLGKLHNAGVDFNPLLLHPTQTSSSPIRYPVPRGTPMLAHMVQWDHGMSWSVPTIEQLMGGAAGAGAGCVYEVDLSEESPDHYLVGHRIDGRVLYPATGYMVLAWRTLAKLTGHVWTDMPVCLQDVAIHRATIMPSEGKVKFEVTVSSGNGYFEVMESGGLVASGRIYQPEGEPPKALGEAEIRPQGVATQGEGEDLMRLTGRDVYKELRLRGYDYGPTFQGVLSAQEQGEEGYLSWSENWVSFLDTMMQIQILSNPGSTLRLPTRIKSLTINPAQQAKEALDIDAGTTAIKALVDSDMSTVYAGGVELLGLHTTVAPRRPNTQAPPVLEEYTFVPYTQEDLCSEDSGLLTYLRKCEAAAKAVTNSSDLMEDVMDIDSTELLMDRLAALANDQHEDVMAGRKCVLLKLLQEIGQVDSAGDAKEMIESNKDLQDDCLFSALINSPSFKCCVDVVRENLTGTKLKITEVQAEKGRLFKQIIPKLMSEPQLQLEYIAASTTESSAPPLDAAMLEELGVTEATWNWSSADPSNKIVNSNLVMANNVLHTQEDLSEAIARLKSVVMGTNGTTNGFILIKELTSHLAVPAVLEQFTHELMHEPKEPRTLGPFCDVQNWREVFAANGLEIVAEKSDGLMSTLFLCKVISEPVEESAAVKIINCDSLKYEWVEELKEIVASPEVQRLWLVSTDLKNSGVVGMVNCLRQEPGGNKIRCVVGACEAALKDVQKKDLVMNVYREGQWGSYRHIALSKGVGLRSSEHAYVNVLTRGDLSSLSWIESPMKHYDPARHPDLSLCHVNYTALNFRDVMLATGKLPPDAIPGDLASQDCILGMEVAGTEEGTGRRVMGLLSAKGLASTVSVDKRFLWEVPSTWSLEQAASVPVVYATAYYALVVRGRIRRGDSVLIHSGSGGVGQAAIAIALHTGCRVFTTVGSAAKREYLLKRFPALTPECFANSRDTTFERHVLKATRGKGVDVVLNSLAEDKLRASLRCLAQHGRFLEIGKVDLSNNSALGMSVFLRNITFHGILLDALFGGETAEWTEVSRLVAEGIQNGAVQPLQTSTFPADQVEDAFRFMAQGKHIGKVVIQVCEESTSPRPSIPCLPRLSCDPAKAYIITGGLGGFGLELAGWLAERGARKLVLTSRAGRARNGFQARRLRALRSAGVNVKVSAKDVGASVDAAKELVTETQMNMGEIGGLFHLAMVLADGFLENQSPETFSQVGAAKVAGTRHLDTAMRTCCQEQVQQQVPWFVVFSSVSCGRGNAGQTSYGFANSFMERVMEQRQTDGLHGVAIQWGAIGDVGVVQDNMGGDNDTVIGGTLPQRITSCLATLDRFLNQPQPVLSSFVPAERKVKSSADGAGGGKSLSQSVAHILGMKDVASINPSVSLGDLGLDSLMGVEVKQCLERADLVLPISEIRALTFAKLAELEGGSSGGGKEVTSSGSAAKKAAAIQTVSEEALNRYDLDEMIPAQTLITLKKDSNPDQTGSAPVTVLIHPIEGSVKALRAVADKLQGTVYGLQCSSQVPVESVEAIAAYYIKAIQETTPSQSGYRLVGYSFGACIAFEMALQLQAQNVDVELVLLDGSHAYVAAHTEQRRGTASEDETEAMCAFVLQFCPGLDYKELQGRFIKQTSFAERLKLVEEVLGETGRFPKNCEIARAAEQFYRELIVAAEYVPKSKIQKGCKVTLIKAENATHEAAKLGDDYGLRNVVKGSVRVESVSGDHTSFIQAERAQIVADIVDGKH